MEKLKLRTPDLTVQNIERVAQLFPDCVTEAQDEQGRLTRAIDFDQLRQELSGSIVEGPRERYHLDLPGNREAILTANAPIAKTLRPSREESVDFDTTKNLFIEGDNLDALKLLQETYLGKVKLIYIDPPYNTGEDRIYRDDFAIDVTTFFVRSNQKDEQGNRFVTNSDSNGRFHSDWLTTLYPRLKLARNLLKEDGVIFISIADHETYNLRQICEEVFGSGNFVGTIVWKNVTDNNPTTVATEHEYIQVYARDKASLDAAWKSNVSAIKDRLVAIGEELVREYLDPEKLQEAYSEWFRQNKPYLGPLDRYKYIDGGGVYTGSQSVHNPGREGYRYDVIHPRTGLPCKEPLLGYRFPKSTMDGLLQGGRILFGEDETKIVELKVYARDFVDKLASVIEMDGRSGPYDLKELFPEIKKVFTNPKPVELITRLISFVSRNEDIVLDFFAGSGTTAQAVVELNLSDGCGRKFVMVQAAEPLEPDTDAAKAGFANVAEICKERIRRANAKAKRSFEERNAANQASVQPLLDGEPPKADPNSHIDTGFRVLKIDTSNMRDVYYTPDALPQADLLGQVDNIRPDRTPEDLLFQVLVDEGVDLALPIAKETIFGKTIFFVDGNALAACFDSGVTDELVKEIAKRKPLRAVFRDASYGSDSVKINVDQIFRLLSPETEVRSI
jgi:adenine-specific DNA-methyltransferase